MSSNESEGLRSLAMFAAFVLLAACSSDTFEGDAPDGGDAAESSEGASDVVQINDAAGSDAGDSAIVTTNDGGSSGDALPDVSINPTYQRIFITSGSTTSAFGGLAAGDAFCNTAATSAGLGGTWKAWLSTSTSSAASHLAHSNLPYRLVDKTTEVAADWTGLTSGMIEHEIDRDENGVTVTVSAGTKYGIAEGAWTGTAADGTSEGFTCEDWTSTSSADFGIGGTPLSATECTNHTCWSVQGSVSCSGISLPLYCVEQ